MAWSLPLPNSVAERIERGRKEAPAGLLLDKYVPSWNPDAGASGKFSEKVQRPTVEAVAQASQKAPAGLDFGGLRGRWLQSLGSASQFTATTLGPLALHLSRASALENAGICLHPLYGFAYLPGSGLKGMARAYAETIWLPAQADENAAWRQIEDVFGWAPNPDRAKQLKHDPTRRRRVDADLRSPEIRSCSGQIVFHDAWPVAWPKLIVDIVNNHHGDYYGAADGDNSHAPGDWENPVPVYFLAVSPGETFEFALAKRRGDVPDGLLELSSSWLIRALTQLGAGAKTAAGYGAFKVAGTGAPAQRVDAPPAEAGSTSPSPECFETTLELVTPAFLAGANQNQSDCDLRGATLRGQLRWWWRTMHAGFVDVATLRVMEAAIWGDAKHGSPLRITVESNDTNKSPREFKKDTAMPEMSAQDKTGPYGIPIAAGENRNERARKTTQGLWYASFGMDQGRSRYYSPAKCEWTVCITARTPRRNAKGNLKGLSVETLLNQAKAALWLLCQYGGVGSRSRKGFGSLAAALDGWSIARCREVAQTARREMGCDAAFQQPLALSPALGQALPIVEVAFSWPDVWGVLDQVGFALEALAQSKAHDPAKASLGLPRAIHGPRDNGPLTTRDGRFLQDPAKWKRREWLDFPRRDPQTLKQNARHASPVNVHIEARGNGYLVRVMAMPAAFLPDLQTSRNFLDRFLKDLQADLQRRSQLPPRSNSRRSAPAGAPPPQPAVAPSPSDWEKLDAVYIRRLGQDHLVQLPDGANVRAVCRTAPKALPKPGDACHVYRQRSNAGEYRWDLPSAR